MFSINFKGIGYQEVGSSDSSNVLDKSEVGLSQSRVYFFKNIVKPSHQISKWSQNSRYVEISFTTEVKHRIP